MELRASFDVVIKEAVLKLLKILYVVILFLYVGRVRFTGGIVLKGVKLEVSVEMTICPGERFWRGGSSRTWKHRAVRFYVDRAVCLN